MKSRIVSLLEGNTKCSIHNLGKVNITMVLVYIFSSFLSSVNSKIYWNLAISTVLGLHAPSLLDLTIAPSSGFYTCIAWRLGAGFHSRQILKVKGEVSSNCGKYSHCRYLKKQGLSEVGLICSPTGQGPNTIKQGLPIRTLLVNNLTFFLSFLGLGLQLCLVKSFCCYCLSF